MRIVVGFLLLIASILPVVAQEYVLMKGQTRDSSLAIIPFANVLALDTASHEMEAFAVSGVDGTFQLRLQRGKVYELKVTYVGYIPYIQYIQLQKTSDELFLIVLKESVNSLDEVTVVAEMPVLVQGDTISYKADAFTDGDERKLEDVLADLPGFDVDENGQIQVQGRRVDKVLVDGKEFFEGDTKLATQNIPADVVDRIQVLQNFNDIAPMSGLVGDNRLALNVELKEDKKRIVFGDVEAGIGPSERYYGHSNAFYYSPKSSLNFIGDANNIGQLALSINDYFRMTGGMSSLSSRNGTTFRLNATDAGIPVTDRNSARSLANKLGALNVTSQLSEKLQLSGFAIGFDNLNTLGSNSFRIYPQLEEVTEERLISSSSIENQSGLARFSAKYTPNYNVQLDYSFFGKRGNILQTQARNSQLLTGSNDINELVNRVPSSQTHQLRWFHALTEKHIASAEFNYEHDENLTNRNLQADAPLFNSLLGVNTDFLFQDLAITSRRIEGVVNYYYLLNGTTHLNTSFGINHSRQNLTSTLANEAASIQDLAGVLSIANQFASLSFRKKWNKLTIDPGVSMNSYRVGNPSGEEESREYIFPRVTMNYDFGSSHNLRVSYDQSLEFGDVSTYTEGFILDGYNTLLAGNSQLKPAIYNSINLNYRNFNTYNFFNIYAGLNHQSILDGFTQNQELDGIQNALTTINSSGANMITSVYANLEKRFNNWRLSTDATVNRTEVINRLENEDLQNTNFSQVYRLNFSAKLFKAWSLRSSYTVTINNYSSGELRNRFLLYQPNVSTVLTIKNFRFESTYTYNRYENPQQNLNSSFDVLDANISYRKQKSAWEFSIQGLNLLDTREVRRDSFSNNVISTYSYFIQQRYGLVSIKYDL